MLDSLDFDRLLMTAPVAENHRQGNTELLCALEIEAVVEACGTLRVDPDSIEVGLFVCRKAGRECRGDDCPFDDCWCGCEKVTPWESTLNVPAWEPLCSYCGEEGFLVEVVGLWGDLKGERKRVKLEGKHLERQRQKNGGLTNKEVSDFLCECRQHQQDGGDISDVFIGRSHAECRALARALDHLVRLLEGVEEQENN